MARIIPIGIDLGTTNSAVAWVDESGRSAMVTNAEGDLLTPSIVFFGEKETVVGKDARSATTVDPDKVAEWVKRDMGRPTYSRPLHGEYLPPEVIQACILRKLKDDVVKQLGPNCRAVITVPAYFDELRRKATADAGEMAGLGVLDIVNEPTAAALAFAETLGYLSSDGGLQEDMTVLVYDLGGGTFDVTLLKLTPGNINTLATDGDVQLGGHDWDDRLVQYVGQQFKAACGIDPRDDPAGVNRLYNAVVEAKHTLSARSKTTVRIDHQGHSHEIPLTRAKFKELTADLLERTAYTCRQLINTAGLSWDKVSRVLLVGGSTRLPMVSEMLTQMTGITPDRTVNPDEAVARGAAIYASYLLAQQDAGGPPPSFAVTNVNAHSLGVEGIDPETMRKKNFVLIARNTSLPAKFTHRFATKSDGQKSIVVQVLEGESSLPTECTMIGRTVIRNLPQGLSKGWPIDVTFEYGTNGRLAVRAVVPGTHHDVRLELERESGLTGDGIARWKPLVASSAGFDAYQAMAQGTTDQLPMGPTDTAGAAPDTPQGGKPATMPQAPGATTPPTETPATASSPWEAASPWGSESQPSGSAATTSAPATSAANPGTGGGSPAGTPPTDGSTPSTAPAADQAAVAAASPAAASGTPPERRSSPGRSKARVPRSLIFIAAWASSAVVGLGAGYLVLHFLRPETFPMPW